MSSERLALFDLLAPYFLGGVTLPDGIHEIVSTLFVESFDVAEDDSGVVVCGVARVADSNQNPGHSTGGGKVRWDWHDVEVDFRLAGARLPSSTVSGIAGSLSDLNDLFQALGPSTPATRTDYPNTQFKLELLVTAVTVHFPGLKPAKPDENGLLKPYKTEETVAIRLPRLLIAITQGNELGSSLKFDLESWGAQGLDADADLAEGELITMTPPYALVNEHFGFGFQTAILDCSDDHTPPEILSQFGFGTEWKGIYLPEVRLFVAPQGVTGIAFNASARNLLIGLEPDVNVTGDFELDIINQGKPLELKIRFFDSHWRECTPGYTPSAGAQEVVAGTALVAVPPGDRIHVVIDMQNGKPPYALTMTRNGATVQLDGQSAELTAPSANDPPAEYQVQVQGVNAQDNSGSQSTRTARFALVARAASASGGSVGGNGITATAGGGDPGHSLTLAGTAGNTAQVQAIPNIPGLVAQLNGTQLPFSSDGLVAVPLDSLPVTVQTTWPGGAAGALTAYFHWAKSDEMGATPGSWIMSFQSAYSDAIEDHVAPPVNAAVTVEGFASVERLADRREEFNSKLADDRAIALENLLGSLRSDLTFHTHVARGNQAMYDEAKGDVATGRLPWSETRLEAERDNYRKAVATWPASSNATSVTATLTLDRPAASPSAVPVQGKQEPSRTKPDFFRRISLIARIVRNVPVAFEIRGEVDFETAAERALGGLSSSSGANALSTTTNREQLPGNTNPEDGVVDFDLIVAHDDSTGDTRVQITIGSGRGDVDGLFRWSVDPNTPSTWLDILGLFGVLAPLLGSIGSPETGGIVALTAGTAVPAALRSADLAHVSSLTLYGGQVLVRGGGPEGEVTITFDYETDFWFKVGSLIQCDPKKPVKVRYKSVGARLKWNDHGGFDFETVFDSTKGYSIDITDPGMLQLPGSLGKILQILSARISRSNPTNFDFELGFKLDLGVISVDRLGIRLPLQDPYIPSITAIGASVDIPNALTGKGYLAILDNGFMGQLDLTITPVKVRIAAGLGIQRLHSPTGDVTAVIVTLAIEFPSPIILGASGLGIYGFLGLFAMHYSRDEDRSALIPALDWLDRKAGGDPTTISAWHAELDHWAFGVGIVLGTLEGAYVINLKGMFVLEIPGPRLLILIKANLISKKPDTKGAQSGTLLAVIDIDFGRGTIMIGISLEYKINKILEIRVPVDAIFDTNHPENFRLDIGTIKVPATISVFDAIKGSGYLEIHGNSIPDFPTPTGPIILPGFSIATGVRISIELGDRGIGLYLLIAGGFDVGVGFSPFTLAGDVFFAGALHLFIIGIEVSARLDFLAAPERNNPSHTKVTLHGQLCGKVELFFFTIEGCVEFTIGNDAVEIPAPPPLARGMYLQSRSPASVQGTGIDRPIDGSLCDATTDGSIPKREERDSLASDSHHLVDALVPIDSIPVLQFEAAPVLDASFTIFGQPPGAAPGQAHGSPPDWFPRGKVEYKYTLYSVSLQVRGDPNEPPLLIPPNVSEIPSVWRSPRSLPDGANTAIDLALLDWTPNATPKALQNSHFLTNQLDKRWGAFCDPVAAAVPVLWTFGHSAVGPSSGGWTLIGKAWPDPPGTRRSVPAPTTIRISEPWRTNALVDSLINVEPARVLVNEVVGELCDPSEARVADFPIAHTPLASIFHMYPLGIIDNETMLADLSRVSPSMEAPLPTRPTISLPIATRPPSGITLSPRTLLPPSVRRGPIAGPPTGKVVSRVLEAPFTHGHAIPTRHNQAFNDLMSFILRDAEWNDSGLEDTIRLDSGPIKHIRVLVMLTEELLNRRALTVRPVDQAGTSLGDITVTGTVVPDNAHLPGHWIDRKGPWFCDVAHAWAFFQHLSGVSPGYVAVLIDLDVPDGTEAVIIGLKGMIETRAALRMTSPSYLVGVVEALSLAEVNRENHDEKGKQGDIDTIDQLANSDPANRPLLKPGTTYDVIYIYGWEAKDEKQHYQTSGGPEPPVTFTFKTDDEAPKRLDPWLLCMSPCPDETFHFYDDPIKIVFSTDDVLQLFKAYDEKLKLVIRGPTPPASEAALDSLEKVAGQVLGPWESALGDLLRTKPCAQSFANMIGAPHGRLTANDPGGLQPSVNYTLNIETGDVAPENSTPTTQPSGGQMLQGQVTLKPVPTQTATPTNVLATNAAPYNDPLFQRSFATSRYGSFGEMAAAVAATRVEHLRVNPGASAILASLAGLGRTDSSVSTQLKFLARIPGVTGGTGPSGYDDLGVICSAVQIEDAIRQCGLASTPSPKDTRVAVLWEPSQSGGPSRAVALLIDGPEPFWRQRLEPAEKLGGSNPDDRYWILSQKTWLQVIERPSQCPVVRQIVRSTNGARALILLDASKLVAANSAGESLHLSIRRNHLDLLDEPGQDEEPLLDLPLAAAPWDDA